MLHHTTDRNASNAISVKTRSVVTYTHLFSLIAMHFVERVTILENEWESAKAKRYLLVNLTTYEL